MLLVMCRTNVIRRFLTAAYIWLVMNFWSQLEIMPMNATKLP
jgi:hypothetical protein